MAKLLKLRRGTTTQHSSFTGAEGEVTVDTDKETLVVHDGSTAGGHPVAAEDLANVSSSTIAGRLSNDSIAVSKIAAGTLPSDVLVQDANISGTISDSKLPSSISSDITGNAASADTVDVAGEGNVSGTRYLVFTDTNGSAKTLGLDGNLSYEANTNTLTAGTFNGSGASLTSLNGGNISSGTISASRIPTLNQNTTGSSGSCTGNAATATNADKVDNLHASSFARSDADDTLSGDITFSNSGQYPITVGNTSGMNNGKLLLRGSASPYIQFQENSTNKAFIQWHSDGYFRIANEEDGSQLRIQDNLKFSTDGSSFNKIWHEGNDGSGSGLDADLWDGNQFSSYLNQAVKTDSNVTLNTIHLDGSVNSNSGGAVFGRNHAYDTVELRGHGSEFMIGAKGTDIHINYRTCNSGTANHTPTTWYWRKGSSSSFSDHHFGAVTANGSITATGNVTAYSDARLKTDIHTINDALSICGKLRGVSYKWIKDGKASIGVIAQEVEEVVPEVVETIQENIGTKDEPEYREVKTVDYGKMVGVLINAINELKAELDELKGGK